ncbi:hypothetical protein MUK42_28451 [Musa troglodytarum]|uniref:Uncharacterized protein n=1 Tax=Musa troglodytarum TaxID=320322 RepID=A0A9E7F6T2_9LILI|nr:hypothetical protein MUK42_28451 [Musa troglodytarum]
MDAGAGKQQEMLLLDFQRCVADLCVDLSDAAAPGAHDFLSLSWVRRLLDAFLICHAEFRALLQESRELVVRSPLDRLVADFCDRAVKALDICNAARDGIDQIRRWRTHLEIVVAALGPAAGTSRHGISEGQLRRARKALADLADVMLDDQDAGAALSRRYRSFSRLRSLSWSVSRPWSASRLLQGIGSNVAAPRSHEVVATAGFAVPVHFSVPRTFAWGPPMTSLHERITEESRKDRKARAGLLKEIQQIERCTHRLTEQIESIRLPMTPEEETGLRQRAEELAQVCEALKEGLDPLERQVREVFLRIVRGRTAGLDCSSRAAQ